MVFRNKIVKFELPDSIRQFDSFRESPFLIFEKNCFLSPSVYSKISDSVHEFMHFDHTFVDRGRKRKSTITKREVSSLLGLELRSFCDLIFSKQFYLWFKSTHLPFNSNGEGVNIFISDPSVLIFKVIRKIKNKLKLPIRFFHTEIEFSSLTDGSYIPAHTDTRDKRLSFILYFPSNDVVLNEGQKKILGTAFWGATEGNSAWSLYDCVLLSDEEFDAFSAVHEVKYRSFYEANKLVGFVKSDKSWHSVDKISEGVDRRTMVVNIYES